MTSIGFMRGPPKYYCQGCGRGFRRRKQHDDHILLPNRFGQPRCKAMRTEKVKDNNQHIEHFIVDPELVSMKDEIVHTESVTTQYYGRAYNFVNIPTGNRHLRAGLPLPDNSWTPRQIQAEGTWIRERNTSIPCNYSTLTLKKTLDKHYITGEPRLPLLGSWNRKTKYERAAI